MKSFVKLFGVVTLCSTLFIGCATTSGGPSPMAEIAAERTPENSVVMIIFYNDDFDLVQLNPAYGPDNFTVKANSGATPPLKPGSCYMKVRVCYNDRGSYIGLPSIYDSLPFAYLNGRQTKNFRTGTKINVPKEPGLYVYYPNIDWDAIKASGALVIGKATNDIDEWKKSSMYRNYFRKHFENCAKLYAGTAWEPLIEEYVEEWSDEE